MSKKPGVKGIGGIFFKCENPENLKKWYSNHLGMVTDEYGSMFLARNLESPEKKEYLQWSAFRKDTDYFDPSKKEFMINYRVNDIVGLVDQLKKTGVQILDEIETYDYGKFVHILDPEGNKIELWEPVDSFFDDTADDEKGNQ